MTRPLIPGPLLGVKEFNERSREIFRRIVESYLVTGEPVGSRALSQQLPMQLSPASIRNVMSDLEQMGLLTSPHTSAGRLPTQKGLRLFVDGLLEVGDISPEERAAFQSQINAGDQTVEDLLGKATAALSGLSQCAGLVVAPKRNAPMKHIEFTSISHDQALTVLVLEDGSVENRMIKTPEGMTPSALAEAGNFLNAMVRGRTIEQAREEIVRELEKARAELSELSRQLIESGLATWSSEEGESWAHRTLIVRGQSNLLDSIEALQDLERIRLLFNDLENKEDMLHLLELTKAAEGVRIFIGAESNLSSLAGSSVIAAPYFDPKRKIVGAIGVIGPTRLNYARIIPMVDYTAKVIGELLARSQN
ncbi:MAG TPA: heat-inducible transcriptional repressor HrcA [Alphaproteobacteria bacterium]|nr:heat-inducible transcriptional repressor HrcA [Alphaproteobacteria bacterium]